MEKLTKSELIKKAINKRVIITDLDDEVYMGWLVVDNERKNYYAVLPFSAKASDQPIVCYRVSHIKHITYINNGYHLW